MADKYAQNRWLQIIEEDIGAGDITSLLTIPAKSEGHAQLMAKTSGVISGWPSIKALSHHYASDLSWKILKDDGSRVDDGDIIGSCVGKLRDILALERATLNIFQFLSGIASLTAQFARAVMGTEARIYDTRKTLPGWRAASKKAVRDGGGYNHRHGLFDMILLKENHLSSIGETSLPQLIADLRARKPQDMLIELEVETLSQFREALACPPDIIMLDNFTIDEIKTAWRLLGAEFSTPTQLWRPQIELSGNITLENVQEYAQAGADRLAIGQITHSAPALDISLLIAK